MKLRAPTSSDYRIITMENLRTVSYTENDSKGEEEGQLLIMPTTVATAPRSITTAEQLAAAEAEALGMADERAYFALGIPCPFLVDDSCGIHPARPLACREYVVASDPTHCATRADGQIVRISATRDVLGAFAAVSAALGEPTEYLLAPAIARPAPEAPAVRLVGRSVHPVGGERAPRAIGARRW